jgi:hypothetical protein
MTQTKPVSKWLERIWCRSVIPGFFKISYLVAIKTDTFKTMIVIFNYLHKEYVVEVWRVLTIVPYNLKNCFFELCLSSIFQQNYKILEAGSSSVFRSCPGLRLAEPGGWTTRVSVLSFLPEDGRRSSFRNVVILLKYRRWTKSKKKIYRFLQEIGCY